MEVRLYAGITFLLLCIITVAFNGTRLLKYITGFTEQIFGCLIALIFIMETGHYIYHVSLPRKSKTGISVLARNRNYRQFSYTETKPKFFLGVWKKSKWRISFL